MRLILVFQYELDSLAAFLKLSTEYVRVTKDSTRLIEDKEWLHAIHRVLDLIEEQMRGTWEEPYRKGKVETASSLMNATSLKGVPLGQGYRFLRTTDIPTETLGQGGLGGVVKRCGLVKSAFRPSDDATTMPFLVRPWVWAPRKLQGRFNECHIIVLLDSSQCYGLSSATGPGWVVRTSLVQRSSSGSSNPG